MRPGARIHPARHRPRVPGFTLLEILLSTAILSVLMVVCFTALDQTQRTWKLSQGKVEQFREARLAFEAITRHLSQATLNPYWDYYFEETKTNEPPEDATAQPASYVRHSELQFRVDRAAQLIGPSATAAKHPGHAVFFQAPLGLSQAHRELASLLNARGFYIEFNSDAANRPPFLSGQSVSEKFRYRLMEYRPPAERAAASSGALQGNAVYARPDDWFQQDLSRASEPLADNIVLLILSPRVSEPVAKEQKRSVTWIAPDYRYNSLDRDNATATIEPLRLREDRTADQGTQHLLPPMVHVTLVALDEPSARKFAAERDNKPVDILGEAGAPFTQAAEYERDLDRVKEYFSTRRLNFRVFSTRVSMRNARWDGR